MKKNYKLLATLVLSGLAGAAFGVLPAEAAVTVGPVDGTEKPLTNNGVYKSVRKYVHGFYQRQYRFHQRRRDCHP